MAFLSAAPEMVFAAAADLAGIGSTIRAANGAAAQSTTAITAAAGDEISGAIVDLFNDHGLSYQSLSPRAAAFHAQFVQSLTGAASSYATAEAAGATSLQSAAPAQSLGQDLLDLINAATNALFGRGLIGNGADGAPGACATS